MPTNEQNLMMIFHDFESNPDGFETAKWPLHMTVVPFFTLENISESDVINAIETIANQTNPIDIKLGDEAMFGADRDVLVTKINDKNGELMKLHVSLVEKLGEIGCKFVDLTYALDNYIPHVSHNNSCPIPSSINSINSISLATRLPDSIYLNKVIEKNFYFRSIE